MKSHPRQSHQPVSSNLRTNFIVPLSLTSECLFLYKKSYRMLSEYMYFNIDLIYGNSNTGPSRLPFFQNGITSQKYILFLCVCFNFVLFHTLYRLTICFYRLISISRSDVVSYVLSLILARISDIVLFS